LVTVPKTGPEYTVTGIMSGTSLDGVDLACCHFSLQRSGWKYRILRAETIPYPPAIHRKLSANRRWDRDAASLIDAELGRFFAFQANAFHRKYRLNPDMIASHGHTIIHRPGIGMTFQAGNGEIMAAETGLIVVSDFRTADVAQGGQGAPLVPVGDRLLFGQYGACLNLGGFANISYEGQQGSRIAYDICPANVALNWLAGKAGSAFDRGGSIARRGRVIDSVLGSLNRLAHYSAPPPKSLGIEWFRGEFRPVLEPFISRHADLMATVVEHIGIQVASSLSRTGTGPVLVTGGGALNNFLMERLGYLTGTRCVIPGRLLVEFKEALVFAFLGVLRIRNEINCLSSVTGGKMDLSAGVIYQPEKQ